MRIALFTNTYWPSVNGVAVSIANLREGLERLGDEVLVVAPKEPGFDHSLDHPGIIRLPSFRPPQKPDYPIALPFFSIGSIKKLLSFEPEVVDVEHPWWVGKWGIRWSIGLNIPSLLTVHTQYGLYAGYSPLPKGVTNHMMEEMLVGSSEMVDLVTTPGEGSRQRLLGLGIKTPVMCVSNPTKLSDFVGVSGQSVREQYGIFSGETLLGYVGRLDDEKNLETLIRAFGIISRERLETRLMIVGDGSERGKLEKLAEELAPSRVIFTGFINHSEVALYFAAIDLFVTPSKSEVQPMSFAEAFATRTPIVAFDVAGCYDMVKDNVSGKLVPLEDGAPGLAAASLELIVNPAELSQLGQSALEWASQYEQEGAVRQKQAAYERAISLHA